jgi:Electron transfer DM13
MSRRRRIVLSAAVVLVVALVAGLAWFEPWKLFIDHTVNETLPDAAARPGVSVVAPVADPSPAPRSVASVAATSTPARPKAKLLSSGRLISHEHHTKGVVSVVRQPDGTRVLTIAGLDTSDGPDVRVWLTDQPVLQGERGWYVFDDGKHVSLGGLKGNLGNQVYKIPSRADLSTLTSVSLWCARFDVSFGAAELEPVR